jgi:hypothetical protein
MVAVCALPSHAISISYSRISSGKQTAALVTLIFEGISPSEPRPFLAIKVILMIILYRTSIGILTRRVFCFLSRESSIQNQDLNGQVCRHLSIYPVLRGNRSNWHRENPFLKSLSGNRPPQKAQWQRGHRPARPAEVTSTVQNPNPADKSVSVILDIDPQPSTSDVSRGRRSHEEPFEGAIGGFESPTGHSVRRQRHHHPTSGQRRAAESPAPRQHYEDGLHSHRGCSGTACGVRPMLHH